MDSANIYRAVNERYSAISKGTGHEKYASTIATSFGYSAEDLDSIPKDANLGLSCGNPLVIAGLKEGEVVVDLGSGAGFDVFQASKKVGATGRAIGVDMNDDMLAKANRNKAQMGASNVEFIKAPITDISPLAADSADCIISNCVVNLVPEAEKQLAFNEMARLLRPGGRVAISDILLKKDLTPALKNDLALYVGCVAGASKVEDYKRYLRTAGFEDILITDTDKDLNVYKDHCGADEGLSCCVKSCCEEGAGDLTADPEGSPCCEKPCCDKSCCEKVAGDRTADPAAAQPAEVDYNEYAGSFKIYAVMP